MWVRGEGPAVRIGRERGRPTGLCAGGMMSSTAVTSPLCPLSTCNVARVWGGGVSALLTMK